MRWIYFDESYWHKLVSNLEFFFQELGCIRTFVTLVICSCINLMDVVHYSHLLHELVICSCINLMDVVHYSHLLHEQPVSTAMHLRTPQVQSLGYKLHSAAQIVTISSTLFKSKMGISYFNILNVLIQRIACSTKILKFATSSFFNIFLSHLFTAPFSWWDV